LHKHYNVVDADITVSGVVKSSWRACTCNFCHYANLFICCKTHKAYIVCQVILN